MSLFIQSGPQFLRPQSFATAVLVTHAKNNLHKKIVDLKQKLSLHLSHPLIKLISSRLHNLTENWDVISANPAVFNSTILKIELLKKQADSFLDELNGVCVPELTQESLLEKLSRLNLFYQLPGSPSEHEWEEELPFYLKFQPESCTITIHILHSETLILKIDVASLLLLGSICNIFKEFCSDAAALYQATLLPQLKTGHYRYIGSMKYFEAEDTLKNEFYYNDSAPWLTRFSESRNEYTLSTMNKNNDIAHYKIELSRKLPTVDKFLNHLGIVQKVDSFTDLAEFKRILPIYKQIREHPKLQEAQICNKELAEEVLKEPGDWILYNVLKVPSFFAMAVKSKSAPHTVFHIRLDSSPLGLQLTLDELINACLKIFSNA